MRMVYPWAATGTGGPTFLLHAVKDPQSGNLDRIQVIKITTKNDKSTKKIFDAVWSGDRKPNPKTGTVPAVGQHRGFENCDLHQ